MRLLTFPLLSLLLLAVGCNTTRDTRAEPEPLRTVAHIDLNKFTGSWYVIAHMPGAFDRRASFGREIYTLDAQGGVEILYTYIPKPDRDDVNERRGHGTVRNVITFAEWLIRWDNIPFAREQFLVLYTDPEHQVAVVSSGNRRNLRILSRTPEIDPALFSDLILFLQQRDFDVATIRRMPQR